MRPISKDAFDAVRVFRGQNDALHTAIAPPDETGIRDFQMVHQVNDIVGHLRVAEGFIP